MSVGAPFFSICIPVYNGEAYLGETIDSVLKQTFNDVEVIVLDNHSSDGSIAVASVFSRKDPRVKVFENEIVLPMGKNWEKAISLATGECIGLLSADDLYRPDFLEEAHRVLTVLGYSLFSANHELKFKKRVRNRRVWAKTGERTRFLSEVLLRNPFSINFTVFRRHVYESVRRKDGFFFKDYLTCDYDLWIRLSTRVPLYYTGQVLGSYRVHGKNLSTDKLRMYRETLRVLNDNWSAILNGHRWVGRFTVARIYARFAVVSVLKRVLSMLGGFH